jgi:RNA polymerase-interacting CarD/CdnL/TRCF family regulator
MSDDLAKGVEKIVVRIEDTTERFRKLREAYERELEPKERERLSCAVNRLNEEISGIKLDKQAESTQPIER